MGRFVVVASLVGWSLACCLPSLTPEELAEMERRAEEREAERKAEEERRKAERDAALPETQRAFCKVLEEHAELYAAAENDLKKSAVRAARGKALRGAVPGGKVADWTGTVKELTTTGQGNAVLVIRMPCEDFAIGTWNNELSDIFDKTLIPIGSPAFAALSEMEPGSGLTFSGTLVADQEGLDGFGETSITERGSMTGGQFLIRLNGR